MNVILITNLYPMSQSQSAQSATKALHSFCKEWVQKGINVKVFVVNDYPPIIFGSTRVGKNKRKYLQESRFILDGVDVNVIPCKRFPSMPISSRNAEWLNDKVRQILGKENFNPDAVLCHGIFFSETAKQISRIYSVPYYLGIHSSDISKIHRMRKYFSGQIRSSAGIFSRSLSIQNKLLGQYPEEKNKCSLIYSGVDAKSVINKEEFDLKWNFNKIETVRVCSVSNLRKLKNTDVLLRSIAAMDRKCSLDIVGDGPERKNLERLVQKLGLTSDVTFHGFQSTDYVLKIMKQSHLFVMPSSPETFGLVYLEAMASGCIPIGCKGEGIDGVIVDGKNGFLVPPRNVFDLKNKIEKLVNLPIDEVKDIANRAYETAKSMSQSKMAITYIDHIKSLRT